MRAAGLALCWYGSSKSMLGAWRYQEAPAFAVRATPSSKPFLSPLMKKNQYDTVRKTGTPRPIDT
eukprot:3288842-Rhodomonas_salina.1